MKGMVKGACSIVYFKIMSRIDFEQEKMVNHLGNKVFSNLEVRPCLVDL
jgi:hypothetical protein